MKRPFGSSTILSLSTLACVVLITAVSFGHQLAASSAKEEVNQTSTNVEDSHGSSMIDGVPVFRAMGSSNAPSDIASLTKRADLIVVVKIRQNLWESKPHITRDSDGGISAYVSFTQASVRKVIKGDQSLKGESIPIAQEMVVDKNKLGLPIILAVDMTEPLVKEGRYIMFLEKTLGVKGYAPIGFWGKHNTDGLDKSEDRLNSAEFRELRRTVRQQIKDDQP
jgi:hypothetical protein